MQHCLPVHTPPDEMQELAIPSTHWETPLTQQREPVQSPPDEMQELAIPSTHCEPVQVPQSLGQLVQVSLPLHLPSPHDGPHAPQS